MSGVWSMNREKSIDVCPAVAGMVSNVTDGTRADGVVAKCIDVGAEK